MTTDVSKFNHFRRVADSIDVSPFLTEIRANRALWYVNQVRQQTIHVQAETNSIALRGGVVPADKSAVLEDSHDIVEISNWRLFPRTAEFLTKVSVAEAGQLARAMLVRLKPQGRVLRHIDTGAYYAVRDRYHLVIQSLGGSEMRSGGERAVFQSGELWCFNNKVPHEAFNYSADWRIHLIFDLLPLGQRLHFQTQTESIPPGGDPARTSCSITT